MYEPQTPPVHPVLGCARDLVDAVAKVAAVEPVFMSTSDKRAALVELSRAAAMVDELRLRVLGSADDVAEATGARHAAAWLAAEVGLDPAAGRRDQRLAVALDSRWRQVAAAMRVGRLDRARAEVVVRALDELPRDLDVDVRERAERHLVEHGFSFGPKQLRRLGRTVLEVVAPEVADDRERRLLEAEDARADAVTSLTSRRRGDGTTELRIRLADHAADRLLTYLHAFTNPRREEPSQRADRRPYAHRLGHAFVAFLEAADPTRLPLHGGDSTTVIVTIDLDRLRGDLACAGVALVGDEPISPAQARRLACTARLIPAVLGGESRPLDLGRARRLFSPAQRKAMAIRDRTCRVRCCDIPAAWCEAHHLEPWSTGGRTDLAAGALLCSRHHHRAHDARYRTEVHPDHALTFHRRT